MNPDVSIVLVTYKRAQFLPRTLDCLIQQTYGNFELLICDDCSPDDTAEVCQAYVQKDERIHYIRNETNLRMPGNLNAGIRRSQCEFVAILHDGDIYAPTIVEKWRSALLRNPTAAFAFNRYRHLSPDGLGGNDTDVYPDLMTGDYFLEKLCFADAEMECPVWGTVMARRSALMEMGLFNEEYGFWSDMDMYFRLAEKFDVAFVPEVLIELPSRNAMPHLFSSGAFTTHSRIFKMYWAARKRHYAGKPFKRSAALAEQMLNFAYTKSRRVARRLSLKQ